MRHSHPNLCTKVWSQNHDCGRQFNCFDFTISYPWHYPNQSNDSDTILEYWISPFILSKVELSRRCSCWYPHCVCSEVRRCCHNGIWHFLLLYYYSCLTHFAFLPFKCSLFLLCTDICSYPPISQTKDHHWDAYRRDKEGIAVIIEWWRTVDGGPVKQKWSHWNRLRLPEESPYHTQFPFTLQMN